MARLLAQMGVARCEWKTSTWQLIQFIDTSPPFDPMLLDLPDPSPEAYETLPGCVSSGCKARIVAIESRITRCRLAKRSWLVSMGCSSNR